MIDVDGDQLPVNVSPDALVEFGKSAVGDMDKRIRHLSDSKYGPDHYMIRINRLGVVAPLIYDAVTRHDHERIILMVLWLNTHFPEITGVEVGDEKLQYVSDEELKDHEDMSTTSTRPKYLH